MRGFYDLPPDTFCDTVEHLLGIAHVTVEEWETAKDAVDLHGQGLDFADALHRVSSAACARLLTFDDRPFVRRARRLARRPDVTLPDP